MKRRKLVKKYCYRVFVATFEEPEPKDLNILHLAFTIRVKVNVSVFLAGWLVVCGPSCLHTSSLICSLISQYGFGHPCHIPLATPCHHKQAHSGHWVATFQPLFSFLTLFTAQWLSRDLSVFLHVLNEMSALQRSLILHHHQLLIKTLLISISAVVQLNKRKQFAVR